MSLLSTTTLGTLDLLAGHSAPVNSRKVTILSGEVLPRGALLGRITATGKYRLSAAASVDGSQTPDLVLAEDTDASGGDREAMVYESGHFDTRAMTLGAGHTVDSVREGLRVKGILLLTSAQH